jgi:uncharacterized protein
MSRPRHFAALVALCLLAAPRVALAQDAGFGAAFAATTLSLSATGETRTPPDMATLSLGVQTTAPDAASALRANAARMTATIAALKTAGIAARDIQTSNLSLTPQYAYAEGKPPRLTGYQASNQVTVQINDLARLGGVVDAAVAAGADNVGQINFGLANPLAAENAARVAAVKALQDKAALYAQAAGYHVGRLVNLSEGGGYRPPAPVPMMAMRVQGVPTTPVEAGETTVRIEVSGVFELAR